MSDLGVLVAELVPLALVIAASPFAVIPAILVLLGERPRAAGLGFLGGWVCGVAAVTAGAVLLADLLILVGDSPRWAAWLKLLAGVVLLALALQKWRGRDPTSEQPAWMAALSEADAAGAFRTAALLSAANPKVALLAVAAGVAIGAAGLAPAAQAGVAVLFVAVASVSVGLPLVLFLAAGPKVLGPLRRARDWLVGHADAVMAVVVALIGLALAVQGIQAL